MRLSLRLAGAALVAAAGPALAVDVDPGDYTAFPAGTNVGLLYYQHAGRDSLYAHGNRVPINAGLDSDVGTLRGIHFMEVGGYTIDPQFLLPFGHLHATDDTSSLGSGSGLSDLILAATLWVVNRPNDQTYLGITPYVWVPSGTYDHNRALNLGENRWKYALQAGYITPLFSDKVLLDFVTDVTGYGDNTNYGPTSATLKQHVSFQNQAYLRYKVRDALTAYAGFSDTEGGKTTVNGVDQDNRISTRYWRVGLQYMIAPKLQVSAAGGSDIHVENGFKEDFRINLRLLKVF